jgi:hypothetical protein
VNNSKPARRASAWWNDRLLTADNDVKTKANIVQKIASVVLLQKPLWEFERWLDRKLKNGTYELHGEELIAGRGRGKNSRLQVRDIRSWQTELEMGFEIVRIELQSGRSLSWIDKYGDLIDILRRVAREKEQS